MEEEKKIGQLGAEYRKNMEYSELLLPKKKYTSYEEQMLLENPLTGILRFRTCEQADKYAYDITGKKNMSLVFARIPMNTRQIREILRSIFSILEKSREYLLKEDSFVLLPEFIFTHFPDYTVELCYYPDYMVPLKEQLERLFETFLNVVDYKEPEAVELVYRLYRKIREAETFTAEILAVLEKRQEIGIISEKQAEACTVLRENSKEVKRLSKKRQSIFGSWLELMRKKVSEREEQPELLPVYEEVPEYAADQRTQIISYARMNMPNLYVEETGEHILLEHFPCYIGSLMEYVDCVIQAEGVSRFHAKIDNKENQYYITDLNSTNGTFLNGCMLNAHEPELLHTGDQLRFANQNFVFFGINR